MHHEVSYRLTKNPDTLATSHCQQCFGRSENSPRELPRSKEQLRSSVLLWMCRLMSSCLPILQMQSEYRSRCVERSERSAPEVEHESALRWCVDLVSLNVCQHCSCTSVHIVCTPANVVKSALAQVFSKTVIHGIESQHPFNCQVLVVMIAHHIVAQVSLVRVISWSSHDERISSTLSPPFPST